MRIKPISRRKKSNILCCYTYRDYFFVTALSIYKGFITVRYSRKEHTSFNNMFYLSKQLVHTQKLFDIYYNNKSYTIEKYIPECDTCEYRFKCYTE